MFIFANDSLTVEVEELTPSESTEEKKPIVLMIDDFQFICGKKSTQEEFFYTFNDLISQGKQIFISSNNSSSIQTAVASRSHCFSHPS